jgi:hypothetical protein
MEDRSLLAALLVSNTADSGPGSLRQAILNSNTAIGRRNKIEFAIPGGGVQTRGSGDTIPLFSPG